MKRRVNFRTTNLDLAAYLTSLGFSCRASRIHETYAAFSISDPNVERWVLKFNSGAAQINLTTFLYHRAALKTECKKQSFVPEAKRGGADHHMTVGQPYWFVAAGQICKALWAPRELHLVRYRSGNVFLSETEATKALKD